MRVIRLSEINPDMFEMIDRYIKFDDCLVTITQDGKAVGSLNSITYLPGISQDNTDQIRFSTKQEMGEKRLYCRQYDGTDLNRYSISY